MTNLKKILPKIAAVILFVFVVAAMILYNEGFYDFTFISRDRGIISVDGTTDTSDTSDAPNTPGTQDTKNTPDTPDHSDATGAPDTSDAADVPETAP